MRLTELVNEASLVSAIRQDRYIRNDAGVDLWGLDFSKHFSDVLGVLNQGLASENRFSPYSYVVLGWSDNRDKLRVRLIRVLERDTNYTRYLQLGLEVAVDADPQEGDFFLGTFARGRMASQSGFE